MDVGIIFRVTEMFSNRMVGAGPVAKWLSSHALLRWPKVRWFGPWAQTYALLIEPCCGSIPYTKSKKIGTDVSSATVFLKQKKKEDWQQC